MADVQIPLLSRRDEVVERLHHFRYGEGQVPVFYIKQMDLGCLQLANAFGGGDVKAFRAAAPEVGLEAFGLGQFSVT